MQPLTMTGTCSECRDLLVRVKKTSLKNKVVRRRLAKYLYPLKEIGIMVYKSRCCAQYILDVV